MYRLTFILLILQINLSFSQTADRTISVNLESNHLQSQQKIWVQLPEGYDTSAIKYSVLYVLDADGHFNYIAQYCDYLSKQYARKMPPIVLVGIRSLDNKYRMENFTPSVTTNNANGGKAKQFLGFLTDELAPYIQSTYNVNTQRYFAGHSLAGLMTIYGLIEKFDFFKGIIAISPSLAYDSNIIIKDYLPKILSLSSEIVPKIYYSVADHDLNNYLFSCKKLEEALKKTNFNWRFDVVSDTDHYTTAPVAFYRALLFLFNDSK